MARNWPCHKAHFRADIIVQNHRFDLLQEFGCVPSIYPSTPAIFLVWMPPLIICSITFVFATLAVWSHIRRNPLISDRAGLPSRVITITFLRPLLMASAICVLVFSVSIFDIQARTSASHGLLPWISWSHVHSDLAHVRVIDASQALDAARIEVSWWLIPTSSMVFILMALVGLVCCVQHDTENSRSVGKWFRSTILRRPGGGDTFIQSTPAVMSRITVTSPTPPLPLTLNAGWDDTLRSTRKSQRPTLKCDIPRTPSTASDTESDASFKASTLTYLTSPTGRQASVLSGLPPTDLPLAKVHPPTPPPIAVMSPSSLDTSAGLSVSPTRSILSSPWPAPPNTVPPTLPIALTAHAREQHLRSASEVSLTTSLASSTMSMSGYLPDPDIFLHSVANANHRVPFQDAGIPMPVTAAPPRHARRTPSKELLPRALIQSASAKRKVGKKREQEEAIYMTVVHETQAY